MTTSNTYSDNYTVLAKNYNVLLYSNKLKSIVCSLLGREDAFKMSKIELHNTINDALLKNYNGELTIKSFLVKEFIVKSVVAAFEIRVNSSRIDFLTINGNTTSFEIKSQIDNLQKLVKQVNNYNQVFEFNYIVIDEKHLSKALQIVPENYGIWIFDNSQKSIVRKALLNNNLNSIAQLQLLTKREMVKFFSKNSIPEINSGFDGELINKKFKECLKHRYSGRWNYIKENHENIFPIDYQFFFNKNISPRIIYEY